MSFIADKVVMDGLTFDDVLLIPAYSEAVSYTHLSLICNTSYSKCGRGISANYQSFLSYSWGVSCPSVLQNPRL